MKRSDILNEITYILDTEYDLAYPDKANLILSEIEKRVRITYPVPFGVWAKLDKNDPEYNIRTVYIPAWEPEDE